MEDQVLTSSITYSSWTGRSSRILLCSSFPKMKDNSIILQNMVERRGVKSRKIFFQIKSIGAKVSYYKKNGQFEFGQNQLSLHLNCY